MNDKLELLSPAGDMERLMMCLNYGADAVYLAGRRFGMRASTVSFSDDELVGRGAAQTQGELHRHRHRILTPIVLVHHLPRRVVSIECFGIVGEC